MPPSGTVAMDGGNLNIKNNIKNDNSTVQLN